MAVFNKTIILLSLVLIVSCNSSQLESELEMLKQENESLENELSKVKDEFVFLEEELLSVKDELNQKIKELQDKNEAVSSNLMNLSYYVNDLQYSINDGWDNDQDWDYTLSRIQNNLNDISYEIEILSNY